ncbi:MAG TPA: hypothetical protein VD758_10425 [Gemmatimonadaceae bacterium]|nr:hypothetical protein [Gemmatimonadaceae bacterium]
MQLLLTLDELRIVARALEKCLAHAHDDSSSGKRETANRLLDKVINHDLRLSADELEDLSAILSHCKIEMKGRIEQEQDEASRELLRKQQHDLEHAADKITEACAMA